MKLIYEWDEALYRDIARKSESKQAVQDVKYARLLFNCNKQLIPICFRDEEKSMFMGYLTSVSCRIIGMATDKEHMGKGLAGALLKVAEIQAKQHGCSRIYTVTKEGRAFYEKYGYVVTDKRSNGWELTKKI